MSHLITLLDKIKRYTSLSISQWISICILILVGVGLPLAIAVSSGSLTIPQADDWQYRRIAIEWLYHNKFISTGFDSMTLIGQIIWVWPFLYFFNGSSFAFAVSTIVLFLICIFAMYYLANALFHHNVFLVFFALLNILLYPGLAWSTNTFMTDIPTFSMQILCLFFGFLSINTCNGKKWLYLFLSLIFGIWGFAIREFALAAPLAVIATSLLVNKRKWLFVHISILIIFTAICFVLYRFTSSIPGSVILSLSLPTWGTIKNSISAYFTLSFAIFPLSLWILYWKSKSGFRYTDSIFFIVFIGLLLFTHNLQHFFVGNYINQTGIQGTEVLPGGRPYLFPQVLWNAFHIIALLSFSVLVVAFFDMLLYIIKSHFIQCMSTIKALPILWTLFSLGGMALYGIFTTALFDRYYWECAFGIILIVLLFYTAKSPKPTLSTSSHIFMSFFVFPLFVLSFIYTLNADFYSAARWKAGLRLTHFSIQADRIDSGYEWVGFHATGVAHVGLQATTPAYEPWYAQIQPGFKDCGVVAASELSRYFPDLHMVGIQEYHLFGYWGPTEKLFLFVSSASYCDS